MDMGRTSGLLARLSIAQKVVLLFAVNVFVAVTISATAVTYLRIISHELEQVAYEDIPLTRHLTEVSAHQLEQAIHLERALRYGELLALGQPTEDSLNKEVDYFEKLSVLIEKDIKIIVEMVEGFLQTDHSPEVIEQFQRVSETMQFISGEQSDISALADQTFKLLRSGNLEDALGIIDQLTEKEDKLDIAATELLYKFEEFTAASMELASEHEVDAKRNVTLMSIVFILLASAISILVYRSVAGPMTYMKQSLVALEDAQSLALPDLHEGTELGKIYHSISVIGNNFDAINRTQAGIFLDVDGSVQVANEKFVSLVGYSADELQDMPVTALISQSKSSASNWDQQWQLILAGQSVSGEYELKQKDGAACWVQATISPIVGINGKTTRVIMYSVDITEEVLRREEIAMISLVASKTDNSVVITDANQKIEYVNEGFTRISGYLPEEAIGRNPGKLLQGKDTSQETIANIRTKIASQEPFYDEILNYNKAGQSYWISLSINPVFDDNGNLIRFVSIQGEVTENKLRNLENERGMRESVAVLNGLAQGKLNKSMEGSYSGTFKEISTAINETVNNLVDVVQRIRTVASTVDTAAREINAGNANLTRRSESAAARLEETSTSMEEITTTVAQNADNSSAANELALGAHKQAEKGGEIVGQAVCAMVEINESSKKIADITGVIDDIAFQTNLLALNASVEAARAGEQGRGFAVVASEVRNLAGRSADAAREIKELIGDSVKRVENGVELVNETGETLEGIVIQVKKVADIVADINSASQEQANGVKLVHNAIVQIDDTTQKNTSLVEQASAASQSTTEQAADLIELIEFFDTGSAGRKNTGVGAENELAGPANSPMPSANDRNYGADDSSAVNR